MRASDLQAEADGAKNHALPLQLSAELHQGQYALVEAVYIGVYTLTWTFLTVQKMKGVASHVIFGNP